MRVIVKPENRGGFPEAMNREETKAYFASKVAEFGIEELLDYRNLFEVLEEIDSFFDYYSPIVENEMEEEFGLYSGSEMLIDEFVTMVKG